MTFELSKRRDRLGRRSRFQRQPKGKRIVLTDRDIEIFGLLWRYRYLRSDRIVSHINPRSPKRLIERLGDLYHETHHISRPSAQWLRAKAEHIPQAYELTKIGIEAYANAVPSLTLPLPAVGFGGAHNRRILQFDHALQISETLLDIEELIAAQNNRRFLVEQDILAKASELAKRTITHTRLQVTIPRSKFVPLQKTPLKTWIVPDALFGIEHGSPEGSGSGKSKFRFYAVEVERRNPVRRRSLEKPSALKKLLAYQALLRSNTLKQQLSLPRLFLIIAASSPQQLLKIKEIADEIWTETERDMLLLAPPHEITKLWQSGADLPSDFVEITQKWFEHFQS